MPLVPGRADPLWMFCRSTGQEPSACWKALSRCRRFCSRLYSCLMLCRICSETKYIVVWDHICICAQFTSWQTVQVTVLLAAQRPSVWYTTRTQTSENSFLLFTHFASSKPLLNILHFDIKSSTRSRPNVPLGNKDSYYIIYNIC